MLRSLIQASRLENGVKRPSSQIRYILIISSSCPTFISEYLNRIKHVSHNLLISMQITFVAALGYAFLSPALVYAAPASPAVPNASKESGNCNYGVVGCLPTWSFPPKLTNHPKTTVSPKKSSSKQKAAATSKHMSGHSSVSSTRHVKTPATTKKPTPIQSSHGSSGKANSFASAIGSSCMHNEISTDSVSWTSYQVMPLDRITLF